MAFLVQGGPDRVTLPHFHHLAQFQVVVEGKGKFGRHDVAPYAVHFTRPYTPYGPLLSDSKVGMSHFTLLPRFEEPPEYIPQASENLKQVPDRRPWQITRQVEFPALGEALAKGAVAVRDVPGMKDDEGLAVYSLTMAPDAKAAAPDPSCGDGQFLIIVKGSLWYEKKEHRALTHIHVEAREGSFQLHAGAQGLEAIVLNFPKLTPHASEKMVMTAAAGFKKWQCELCAFAYDEALGLPDDGIPAGTRWEDVPESWTCPDCATTKSDFQMIEV